MSTAREVSRRTIIAGASVLATGTAANITKASPAAVSIESDPIFAAIAAHERAYATWLASVKHHSKLEQDLPHDKRRTSVVDEQIVETDDPRWIASERAVDEEWEVVCDAAAELVNVEPTTRAGVIALLRYIAEDEKRGGESLPGTLMTDDEPCASFAYFVHQHVADVLERMIAA